MQGGTRAGQTHAPGSRMLERARDARKPDERGTRMKLSARNKLKGTVSQIKEGPVNSTVQVDVGGGNMVTAMVTSEAVADLGLSEGKEVYVIIKASQVMLGAE